MLLICMSIAGTVPLIICLLLLLLQRKKFSYRLGRNLVFLSLAGYLIPFQVVKYLMPTDVLIRTDALANISYYINFDDKGAISYHGISLWMSDWILMIGLCWLFLISGFSVYEIIKYHRLTRKLKKITEKRTCFLPGIGDVEYRISPLIGSPYTIGFLKPFIVAPESLEDSRLSEMILRHEYSHLRRHCSRSKVLSKLLKTFDKTFREIFPVFISTKRREKPSAFFDNNFVNNAYFSEAASSSSSHLASSSSKAPISSRMTCLCLWSS